MARGSYTARRGWSRQLCRGTRAIGAQRTIGQRLASEIEANLPVRTGQLKADWGSMSPTLGVASDGLPQTKLPIGSHVWHLIEYGSVNNPAYAPIRRAADAVGLEFESGGPG